MYAVEIRSKLEGREDTRIDTPVVRPRRRLRPRRQPAIEAEPQTTPEETPATQARTRVPLPRRASTLAELRVLEAPGRKAARRLTTQVPRPQIDGPPVIEVVRIDWVRSEDATQTISTMGNDGIVIQCEASGERSATTRVGAASGNPRPGVAVGVDSMIYTVRVEAGDTPANTARRLAARLRNRFIVEVTHHGAGYTLVRLTGERRS